MQIIIELSDETYKDIKEENSIYGINNGLSARMTGKVVGAIQNGVPLPKGHGDVVDIETLIDMFWDGNSMEITKYDLSVIDPIIEADKEQEDEKTNS